MALFGEKYGDWVRMVEIDGVSRELCGGTHVANTAELGLFHLLSETSSASNVRRIEAVTGRAGAELFRERSRQLRDLAALLRVPEPEVVRAVERLSERVKELQKAPAKGPDRGAADELAAGAEEIGGLKVVVEAVAAPDARALLELSDTVRQRLGDSAVVLGAARRRPRAPGGELRARGGGARASAPTRWCVRRRRWWAAAAAGATRWRRPADAIRRSCPTRWPRPGSRSSGRSPDGPDPRPGPRRRRAAAVRCRTPPAPWRACSPPSSAPTPARGCPRSSALVEDQRRGAGGGGASAHAGGRGGRPGQGGACILRAPCGQAGGTGGASRRTTHHPPGRAHGRCAATSTRARRPTCSRAI